MSAVAQLADSWNPADWRRRDAAQQPAYPDRAILAEVERTLAGAAPVVDIVHAAALRGIAARVAQGSGFILQGGDCAESLGQDPAQAVTALAGLFDRLAVLLPGDVTRIGRIAGQFAKPRSNAVEVWGSKTLPAYRGDGVNGAAFTPEARRADPRRMLAAHAQSVETAALLRTARFPMFASHEALLLPYEQALARREEDGRWWVTSGHMLWVGERSREVDGAHVHFLSGIENMVGVKCGPSLGADELLRLLDRIDPANRPGKVALIARFGAAAIGDHLPALMRASRREGRRVLWMSDPMHGNSRIEDGRKVRTLADILAETRMFFSIAASERVRPAGLHLEMSPDDVSECIGPGGPGNFAEMGLNFQSLCDPRLNAVQAEQVVRAAAELIS